MTVICWDGQTLAADRQMHDGTDAIVGHGCKLIRLSDTAIGAFSGAQPVGRMLANWFSAGAVEADFPAAAAEKDSNTTLMVVHVSGVVELYCNHTVPSTLGAECKAAIGAGAQEARVAMHCGKTAAEAVLVASLFDPFCGGGVDTMTFEDDDVGDIT